MLKSSLGYEPVELTFGTSGLRGLVADMTDLEVYINTRGFLAFLEQSSQAPAVKRVLLGGDLRASTPRIMQAVATACADLDYQIINCGLLPTPAIALKGLYLQLPAIMVTGSHIPADRNGIKFYKPSGEVLKIDEAGITKAVATVRSTIYGSDNGDFNAQGNHTKLINLPDENKTAQQKFIERCQQLAEPNFLSGKAIAVYQHSAVGRDMLVSVLEHYGATVVTVGRSNEFVPIDTENVTPENEAYFKQIVSEHDDVFAVVSTDGDSDRPFVIDENGVFHRGDVLGAVIAEQLQADAVAIPVSSSDAVDQQLSQNNVAITRTKIGSPHVIVAMQDLAENHQRVVGWEVNGGFLIHGQLSTGSGKILPLPTRDAFLPIILALKAAADANSKVSEIFAKLPARYTQAGLIDNFAPETSRKILEAFSNKTEADELIQTIFRDKFNFAKLKDMNSIDGVQLIFENNEVFHIRPSGNAPQMRIYSVASSQERANELVRIGISEPNGILRALEKETI